MIKGDQTKILSRFNKAFASANQHHTKSVDKYKKCDDAYNAKLERAAEGQWQSDLHPPYALQIVELIESSVVDAQPRAKVIPVQPKDADGAKILEAVLNQQRQKIEYGRQLRTFIKQGLIRGVTAAKIPWLEEWRTTKTRQFTKTLGGVVQQEADTKAPVLQQPGFVPIDMKDFWWDGAATSLDDAAYVFFRTYETLDSLKMSGVYENLKDVTSGSAPQGYEPTKSKGRVEVIEWWHRSGNQIRLTVVANRQVIIRDECSPFWHGQFPFVTASPVPQMFKLEGKGIVELIADIQAALWEMQNHRLDNTRFMSNAAVFVDPNTENQDLRLFPGAILRVRPSEIQPWTPATNIIQPSIQAEEMLKGDLTNLSGAVSYLSGASDTQIDQSTATGISIIQNMATKRMMLMREQFNYALRRAGSQWVSLNQQLLPQNVAIRIDTNAGQYEWKAFNAAEIQGQYEYNIEDASESLIRQEKRAEALTKSNFFLNNYALLQQAGIELNVDRILEDVTEAFDEEPSKYFSKQPQAPSAGPPLPGGGDPNAPTTPTTPPDAGTAPDQQAVMTPGPPPPPAFGGAGGVGQ